MKPDGLYQSRPNTVCSALRKWLAWLVLPQLMTGSKPVSFLFRHTPIKNCLHETLHTGETGTDIWIDGKRSCRQPAACHCAFPFTSTFVSARVRSVNCRENVDYFFTAELFYSVIQRQETSLSLSVTYALHVGGRTEPEEVGPPPLLRSRLRRPLSPKTGGPPLAVLCVCRRGDTVCDTVRPQTPESDVQGGVE